MCYKDQTFCPFDKCNKFDDCDDALTKEVRQGANRWWSNFPVRCDAPISVHISEPECFENKNKEKK